MSVPPDSTTSASITRKSRGIVFAQALSVEDEPTMTQIGKLGSVSFGSWWCGAGNDPRTSPLLGGEPTMRKGSYSEELVRIDLHVENPVKNLP